MRSACALVTAGACWPSGTMTVAVGVGVGEPAELRPGVGGAAGEQQGGHGDDGQRRERAATARDAHVGWAAGADDALVVAFDREVDRLGDGERKTLATGTPRAAGVPDAEDVEDDAEGHDQRRRRR